MGDNNIREMAALGWRLVLVPAALSHSGTMSL